jgi:hypothetical protein
MFQEHLKSCGYCQSNDRATKLAELGHMIRGTSAGTGLGIGTGTKGASSTGRESEDSRRLKLRELSLAYHIR